MFSKNFVEQTQRSYFLMTHKIPTMMPIFGEFFKDISDHYYFHPTFFAIVFCSYGSTTSRNSPSCLYEATGIVHWTGKPWCINDDEVVRFHNPPLCLHEDVKEELFAWSGGHVGALVRLLELISLKVILLLARDNKLCYCENSKTGCAVH